MPARAPRAPAARRLAGLACVSALAVGLGARPALAQRADDQAQGATSMSESGQQGSEPSAPRVEALTEQERAELARYQARPELADALSWRVGPSLHTLNDSLQGRPLVYPALGARYKKPGAIYVDVHLPALFGLFDGLQYVLQRDVIERSEPFNVFQTLNQPRQYVFAELGHARVGQSWAMRLGEDPERGRAGVPLRLTAGLAGVADWAILEATRLQQAIEEAGELNDLIQRDPLILGPALFGAVGLRRGPVDADLALELGRDLLDWDSYQRSAGWVISADLDVHVTVIDDLGLYLRARLATYTHLPGRLAWTLSVSPGISFRF